jgi:hypothetical protein
MQTYVRRLAVLSAVAACALLSVPAVVSAAAPAAGAPRPADLWLRNGWLSPQNQLLSARIFADQRALGRLRIELTQWGPDSVTGKTRIFLTHYTAAAARLLRARYGTGVEVAPFSEPRPALDARGTNVAPYIGGDFIKINSAVCTGGPIVKDDAGNYEMLTAGHCTSSVGDSVYRSDYSGQTGPYMGSVVDRDLCNGCLDVAVVDGSGGGYKAEVWGDAYNTPNEPRYLQNGNTAFPDPANCSGGHPTGCAGDTVTQDSAVTGEIRGITVYAVNQSVNFIDDGITRRALSEACSTIGYRLGVYACILYGTEINHGGDSGGPWIVHGGTGVAIAGTTVGGTAWTAYYEQIGSILSRYDLSIPKG